MYSGYSPQVDEAEATGLLQCLGIPELQQLCEDDDRLTSVVHDLQQVKNLEVQKQAQITSNKSVAEYNLSKEPRLAEAKEQLARTYQQGIEIQKAYEKDKQELDYQAKQQSLDTVLALLQTEAAKAEETSEELSDKFLEGEVEVENFVDSFLKQRTAVHLLKVKSEKMHDIMQESQRQASGAAAYRQQNTAANSWGGAQPAYSAYPR